MPENLKKVFYALDDPLSCLFYTRDIVRSAGNIPVNVLLPKHIDPSRFEFLLLKDAEYFNGITVQGISSFPRRALASKGYFDLPPRVDQIELSEHFHGRMPRSLARPLLNAVLELKHAYFEQDYIKELLGKRREKEGAILLEVFDEYQAFLERKGCNDDADHKKFFMEKALVPGSDLIPEDSIFIFAGFHEFSSFDLDIIKAVSSRAAGTFVVSPNILDTELEYSKLLDEQLTSMGFKTVRVKNERSQDTKVHEFGNINDEAYYVSKTLKTGTVYAVTDVDNYYSLMRYHLGGDAVSINAAMRLDRSCYLTVLSTMLLLNTRGWIHHDVVKLLHFIPFWKNEQGVLTLISTASNELTLPRGYDTWQRLAAACGDNGIQEFFKAIKEKIPSKATPLDLEKALKLFFSSEDDLEMESVMNLVTRLVGCLCPKEITVESFVRKLYDHAEENYVLKGPLKFKSLNVTLAGLAAGNIAEDVWFVGMNQDAFSSIAGEDVVMNDDLILAFRPEGFLRSTSRESAAIASKIIKDASRSRTVSYVSSVGAVADIYKDIEPVKHKGQITAVLNGAISEFDQKELVLKEHKFPRYSASLFKDYIECPYVCFATKILKAQKKEAMDLSLQPKDAGNLLHKALELLLPRGLKNEKLDIEAELGNILATEFRTTLAHILYGRCS